MTSSFIGKLKERLSHPLPGLDSHRAMRPLPGKGVRINFEQASNPRPGAVLILFYEKDGLMHFPLIQRPVYQGIHSGQMALPGGKKEVSDATLFDTALRESNEEIGIHADRVVILGALSSFLVAASNHMVLPVVGYYPEEPVFYPDQIEVEEVIAVQLNDLMDENRVKRTIITVRNDIQLDSPYFDLAEKVVWGATAGILNELKLVVRDIGVPRQ